MTVQTTNQRMARQAFERVAARKPLSDDYVSFAREFPTLVHSCGLAQASAFALAKGGHQEQYLGDLAAVLSAVGHTQIRDAGQLTAQTRTSGVTQYLRLSRDALAAAVWLKRYAEALAEE